MAAAARGSPARRGTVLVCDDTESIRRLLKVNLELEGFDVLEASDGAGCLSLLTQPSDQTTTPDVVVLDAQMRPRDGWWAIRRVRRDPRVAGIPVIMITASHQANDRRQAADAGFDAFMGKPFDPDELIGLVVGYAQHGRGYEPRSAAALH